MIGIFGGTFDPVHFGHLRPVLDMQQALGLEEVRMIPCRVPPHREQPTATPEQRLDMLRKAVQDVPGLVVDTRELERDGPSYMVDTLDSIRAEAGENRPLVLLLGMDAMAGFHRWREPERILELAHIGVAQRPGGELPSDQALNTLLDGRISGDVDELRGSPAGKVIIRPVTQLDISATRIRELLANRQSPRFLLPDEVLDWIEDQGLYRG